jgi:uncharacterized protein YbjT (DUF2867 family)
LIVIHDHQALVRKADEEVVNMLPRSVEVVIGDVGDPSTVKAAVEGCNKIIYCATARSTITGDLFRVDHRGVYNLTKAFQVWPHPETSLLSVSGNSVCVWQTRG